MGNAASPPRLLQFRVSHYNEKVRWALDYKRVPHVRESLLPGFHIPRLRRLTGQNKCPVLIVDGKPLADSSNILREIERRSPDPPLYPATPVDRARAIAIEKHFDEQVAPDLRRLFWSTYLEDSSACARMASDGFSSATRGLWRACLPLMRPLFRRNMGMDSATIERARAGLFGHFERLESEIGPSGYLVGECFGIADLAAASVMTAIIRPPEFSYPLPEPWPQALVDLRGSVADRPGFRWVLDVYARHRGSSSEIAPERGSRRAHAATA